MKPAPKSSDNPPFSLSLSLSLSLSSLARNLTYPLLFLQMLQSVYTYYGTLGANLGMDLDSFLSMLDHTCCIGSEIWDLSERECRIAFFCSKNVVVDEQKSHKKLVTMTFIEFMEAMAWIADLMPIPTEVSWEAVKSELRPLSQPCPLPLPLPRPLL